jgi:hypothetical protein
MRWSQSPPSLRRARPIASSVAFRFDDCFCADRATTSFSPSTSVVTSYRSEPFGMPRGALDRPSTKGCGFRVVASRRDG